ncbi:MAG TPA: enoyl-CoA hydratase-related protein [Candidatus Binatia bacterium]|nr:enoyl-CoA hydratase-related protein [Candidatus Binatia bacterium]
MAELNLGSKFLHGNLQDGVLTVALDRPERRNACTIEMYHGIKKAAVIAEKDPGIDVLVITGTGDVFCPGGEMGGQHEGGTDIDRETDRWDLIPFIQLERCPKTVVCAVNGLCQGGGLNMVLMSDVCVASDRAQFRAPELLRGVADCWLSARLAAHVGVARAKYMLFTAATVAAADALAMGLIARVVPHATLQAAVAETVAAIRQTAPGARKSVKRDIHRGLPPVDLEMFTDSLASEEVAEGFRAFIEKRKPSWVR